MATKYFMTIDNEDCLASDGGTFEAVSPFSGDVLGHIPAATKDDVDRAVRSSQRAFRESWWRHDPRRRGMALLDLADRLAEAAPRLADIEARDNGKTIKECLGINGGALPSFFRFAAAAAMADDAGTMQVGGAPNLESHAVRQPYGVVAVQVPWNNPLGIWGQESASALAAGNAIVVKPSEFAACSVLSLGDILRASQIPPGIINIVSGFGSTTGAALCEHQLVRKIIFTGGGEAARHVAHAAADRLVPIVLELGGKSPNIVFDDANLDLATAGIVGGYTGGTGQSCVCGSRTLIHRPIYDEMVARLRVATSQLVIGDPLDPNTDIGPLASPQQFERVSTLVQSGIDDGATLLIGGGRPESPAEVANHPLFFAPTIFTNVDRTMRIMQEEIFGPVTALVPFEDEKEALDIANDTPFGLAAGVWSRDLNRVRRMSRELDAGTVYVNCYRNGDAGFPYGGIKESGYGRECGLEGLREMSYVKDVRIWYED